MDVSGPTIEHPDPLPVPAVGTLEAKSKQRTGLKNTVNGLLQRNGMSAILPRRRVADEEASVDRPTGSLDDESWQEPLHASVM